jgi:tetratricopeptide (TPR) repeat protein
MSANLPPLLVAGAPADHFAMQTVRSAFDDAGIASELAPQDADARSAIIAAVAVARVLVVVHSRAAANAPGVLRAAEAAAGRRLPILVVRLDDAKPAAGLRTFLRGSPSIDATGGKLPQRLPGIVARVKEIIGIALAAGETPVSDAGIDIVGLDRRVPPLRWLVIGAIVIAAIGVLAWRGFERAAADSAYERGVAKLAGGDLDGAVAEFDRVLAYKPQMAEAWRQRGFASRDRAQQIASFSRAIALDAHDADALAARGRAYFASGDAERARVDMAAALQLVPDNAEWHGERALFALAASDADAAARDFRECARLEPRCPQAFAARIEAIETAQGSAHRDWFAAQ